MRKGLTGIAAALALSMGAKLSEPLRFPVWHQKPPREQGAKEKARRLKQMAKKEEKRG